MRYWFFFFLFPMSLSYPFRTFCIDMSMYLMSIFSLVENLKYKWAKLETGKWQFGAWNPFRLINLLHSNCTTYFYCFELKLSKLIKISLSSPYDYLIPLILYHLNRWNIDKNSCKARQITIRNTNANHCIAIEKLSGDPSSIRLEKRREQLISQANISSSNSYTGFGSQM